MNLVYGFGGLTSDGDLLCFNPNCPEKWKSFSFNIQTKENEILSVKIDKEKAVFKMSEGAVASIKVFDKRLEISESPVSVPLRKKPEIKAVIFDLEPGHYSEVIDDCGFTECVFRIYYVEERRNF